MDDEVREKVLFEENHLFSLGINGYRGLNHHVHSHYGEHMDVHGPMPSGWIDLKKTIKSDEEKETDVSAHAYSKCDGCPSSFKMNVVIINYHIKTCSTPWVYVHAG
jgi:hypothetical protein